MREKKPFNYNICDKKFSDNGDLKKLIFAVHEKRNHSHALFVISNLLQILKQ